VATLPLLQVTPSEIVVCKPPGLASELPRDPRADSLLARLRAEGYADVRLVHRLDAPACGVMIVARTAAAAAHYSTEIEARRWKKVYVAEVAASVDRAKALLGDHKAYLAIRGQRATVVRAGGKPSFLTIAHAAPAGAPGHSHLLVRLHTGRFHQIRVMLANLGAPLAGDTLYGGTAGDTIYLEQVLLAARPFNAAASSVWRAPAHAGRPAWSSSLADAVNAEEAALLRQA
jgi:23S rRNA-/tRNA-specific pseudouridylate synthase